MATKAQMYAQMADHAAVQLTSSWNEWMRFLDTGISGREYISGGE